MAEQPDIPEDAAWYIGAFSVLSQGRPVADFDGAIPISEMASYMEIFGIDEQDEREEFVTIIRRMDSAYLKERAEVIKRARNSPTKSRNRRV